MGGSSTWLCQAPLNSSTMPGGSHSTMHARKLCAHQQSPFSISMAFLPRSSLKKPSSPLHHNARGSNRSPHALLCILLAARQQDAPPHCTATNAADLAALETRLLTHQKVPHEFRICSTTATGHEGMPGGAREAE